MSLREDQVAAAVRFLGNEKVASRPPAEKQAFLQRKGLTGEEIAEAFKRYEQKDSDSAGADASSTTSTPAPAPAPAAQPSTAGAPQQQYEPPAPPPAPAYPPPPPSQAPPQYNAYPPQWQAQQGGPPASPYSPQAVPYSPYGGYPSAPMMQPYDIPAQGSSGGPWWAWALGGSAAGVGLGLLASSLLQRREAAQEMAQVDPAGLAMLPRYPYDAPDPYAAGAAAFPQLPSGPTSMTGPAAAPAESPAAGQQSAQAAQGTQPSQPSQPDAGTRTVNGKDDTTDEPSVKVVSEDLIALLRQHGEEAKETAAVFKKAIQQQQEQYQTVFTEMQKVLTSQTQQQKSQKAQPLELSAATLQSLASLMQPVLPAAGQAEQTEGVCNGNGSTVAVAAAPAGAANPLRESFDAINMSLQRLRNESSSKVEVSKSLQTISMLLQNFVSNPEKHRKINTSSARFAGLAKGPAAELLKHAGFQFQEPCNFVFPAEQDMDACQRTRDLIQEAQRNLDQTWATRSGAEASRTEAPNSSSSAPPGVGPGSLAPGISAPGIGVEAEANGSASIGDPSAGLEPQPKALARPVEQSLGAPVGNGGSVAAVPGVAPAGALAAPVTAASGTPAAGTHLQCAHPADSGEVVRRPMRPWESSALAKQGSQQQMSTSSWVAPDEHADEGRPAEAAPSPPIFSGGMTAQPAQMPVAAHPSTTAAAQSVVAPTMAHPAESPESGPGPAVAHPAESAVAHPAESEDAHTQQPQLQAQQPQQQLPPPQQPPQPQQPTPGAATPATAAMAHPAERSAVSEEPQSGG